MSNFTVRHEAIKFALHGHGLDGNPVDVDSVIKDALKYETFLQGQPPVETSSVLGQVAEIETQRDDPASERFGASL